MVKKRPDIVTQMAQRGAATQQEFIERTADQPGEESMSTEDLAASYLNMDFRQRIQLFQEVLAMHGPKGLELTRDIMHEATAMYQEDTGGRPTSDGVAGMAGLEGAV